MKAPNTSREAESISLSRSAKPRDFSHPVSSPVYTRPGTARLPQTAGSRSRHNQNQPALYFLPFLVITAARPQRARINIFLSTGGKSRGASLRRRLGLCTRERGSACALCVSYMPSIAYVRSPSGAPDAQWPICVCASP